MWGSLVVVISFSIPQATHSHLTMSVWTMNIGWALKIMKPFARIQPKLLMKWIIIPGGHKYCFPTICWAGSKATRNVVGTSLSITMFTLGIGGNQYLWPPGNIPRHRIKLARTVSTKLHSISPRITNLLFRHVQPLGNNYISGRLTCACHLSLET